MKSCDIAVVHALEITLRHSIRLADRSHATWEEHARRVSFTCCTNPTEKPQTLRVRHPNDLDFLIK